MAVTASPRGPLTRPGGLRSPVPASGKSRSVGPAAGFGVLPDRPADASDLNVGCDVRHSKRCGGRRAVAAAPSLVRVGRARFATASRPALPVAALVHRVGDGDRFVSTTPAPGRLAGAGSHPRGIAGGTRTWPGRPRRQRAAPSPVLWQERARRRPEASSTHCGSSATSSCPPPTRRTSWTATDAGCSSSSTPRCRGVRRRDLDRPGR